MRKPAAFDAAVASQIKRPATSPQGACGGPRVLTLKVQQPPSNGGQVEKQQSQAQSLDRSNFTPRVLTTKAHVNNVPGAQVVNKGCDDVSATAVSDSPTRKEDKPEERSFLGNPLSPRNKSRFGLPAS